ncbi:hypothetical protein AMTR_s00089p00037270 [Amborella trichopoda]|uniref:CHORD domain-containing protein n=1 Tax=Amborella trichopoda TaxID=13333 RepID=W1P1M2_AMBTC|nr:hypothetical protein AMTR_s00089p00037270 [Amborella trichopoda]
MAEEKVKVRCQRIGCVAFFSEDDNPEGSCTYHHGPIFHDGGKEWSCCKQRSHDFSLFLELPGCKKGQHTTEKPITKAAPSPNKPIPLPSSKIDNSNVNTTCSRCRNGYYCSDHGSQSKLYSNRPTPSPVVKAEVESKESPLTESKEVQSKEASPAPTKAIDINQIKTCRNKGCGKSFREKDNHETACEYHPGPAIFHDRIKGWKCCDVHLKEFDEFMAIPPCQKGWHNANPDA